MPQHPPPQQPVEHTRPQQPAQVMQPAESSQPAQQETAKRRPRRERAPVRGLALYAQVVLVAMLCAATSLAYLRYFATADYLIAPLVAATLAAATAAIAAIRRWGIAASVALSVVCFVLVAVFAVFRATLNRGIPTWTTVTELGAAMVSGWARMLSVSLPADATGDLVLTPTLATWIAAAAATTTVIRGTGIVVPLLFPVLAYGLALLFTAGSPLDGFLLPAVLLGIAAVVMLFRAGVANKLEHAGARAIGGHIAFGLPVAAIAVAGGIAGAQLLPVATGEDRFDLRDVVPRELDIDDHLSPLVTLKPQLKDPETELFTVRFSGDSTGVDRVRTAALEHYDGALWSSRDTYLLAGSRLRPAVPIADPRRVTMTVEIIGLSGPYLPSVGAPIELSAERAGFSEDSGVLVTDASLSGMEYRMVAQLPSPEGLEQAVPLLTPDSRQYTALPEGLPSELSEQGAELAGVVDEPFAKLSAIRDHLRELPYNADARPGHSYEALRRLFDPDAADRAGYAEQFAAAFAVLARSQGFPTRVAVGYLLNEDEREGDTYTVSAGDAHAWAEVHLDGYGWVTFDPTNPENLGVDPPEDEEETPEEKKAQEEDAPPVGPGEDPALQGQGVGPTVLDWALWVLVALAILAVATPLSVAAEKLRRTRRRRSGSRAARIIGAWQESADRLVEYGVRVSGSDTAQEVARGAQTKLGEPASALAVLAPLATRAMYSPVEPEDSDVRQAWELDARLGRDLRKGYGWLTVLRGWVDPRPLVSRWRDKRRRQRDYTRLMKG